MKKKRGDAKTKVSKKEKLSKKRAKDFCFREEKLLFFKPKTDQKPREKSAYMDETKRKFESQRYVWCELFVLGVL